MWNGLAGARAGKLTWLQAADILGRTPPCRRSRKRTYAYVLRSMRTLRFLLITRAGRLTRLGAGMSCDSPRTQRPRPSTPAFNMRSRPELISDWG
jgi:hypothetical protein